MPSGKKKDGRLPAARVMLTPGSYKISGKTSKTPDKVKKRTGNTPDKVKRWRLVMKKKRRVRRGIIHR
jgi:hypothetical protein